MTATPAGAATVRPGAAPPSGPGRADVGLVGRLAARLINAAGPIRAVSRPLLAVKPTLRIGRRVVVLRHADVVEVLERDGELTVAELTAAPMARVNGPFILGMDRSPLYDRERAILQAAVHPEDPERIRATVRRHADELLAPARATGRLDVVQGYARPAAVRLVADYLGVPGPDEATMARWMRDMFYETFLNVGDDPAVRRAGVAAGDQLHAYADALIARRRAQVEAGEPAPDDVLTRLVRLQGDEATRLADEGVRRNIGGVIVGAVDTTSKAVTHAVDQLLRRPDALAGARAAALAGDVEAVGRHAFEALRFSPINPVLARHGARDVVLAAGTRRQRHVPAGSTVYAAVLPAMFDPAAFPRPSAFRTDRPAHAYLHFGAGLHTCFGRYVNAVQIPELVAALVRQDGLRAARDERPRIRYDGPFPDRFVVELTPAP